MKTYSANPFLTTTILNLIVIHGTYLTIHAFPTWTEIEDLRQAARDIKKTALTTTVWPLPQQYNSSKDQLMVIENFHFRVQGPSCSILDAAVERYGKMIFEQDWDVSERFPPNSEVASWIDENDITFYRFTELFVMLDPEHPCHDSDLPDADMDEHYEMFLRGDNQTSVLAGNTVWGVIRGLETFSQMIWRLDDGRLVVNQSTVMDWPRFSHRGLMLDTSRHFISKKVILQNLDIMAMNKFNVFHWHIVDDESFPYQSTTFPDLSTRGAWEPRHHVYTQNDIAEIIEYARLRGIRVVAEFDTPGHTRSWGYALKKLVTPCYSAGVKTTRFGPVNPILNSTYETLKRLFTEILEVFPDQYLHLGGDEVEFSCWQTNPAVLRFMKNRGFGQSFEKLEEYYLRTLLDVLGGIPKNRRSTDGSMTTVKQSYIVWQDVFDNNVTLDDDTIIHVWKDRDAHNWKVPTWQQELATVTQAGFKAILSSCWYLNYISYGSDWKAYYRCDPEEWRGKKEQKDLVIGGEACMWGEFVDDTNVLVKLWPRASAVAERLWANREVERIYEAGLRLGAHRCLMNKRGFPAEPNLGPDFCQREYRGHLTK